MTQSAIGLRDTGDWFVQTLPEEVAMATGRKVRQLTEPSIANGLVEVRGLEAERVQP